MILKSSVDKGNIEMQVFGDSKLSMDWCNECCNIANLALNHMLFRIEMQVLGDLKLSMDWCNECCNIANLALNHMLARIMDAKARL